MADRYTKAVLTVIAGCLLYLCLNAGTPRAHAATTRQSDDVMRVEIVGVGSHNIEAEDALPINIDELGGSVLLGAVPVVAASH